MKCRKLNVPYLKNKHRTTPNIALYSVQSI